MSAVDQFSNVLQELYSSVKPPGVSGSRIKKLTSLAVDNVSEEAAFVQQLFSHCKSSPVTHKLGTVYVVDAVVRAYHDRAKQQGEACGEDAVEGTFGAGVYQISQLIGEIMDDALGQPLPGDQKLVDIWDKADTFPKETVESIREKYYKPEPSTTPAHSPSVQARDFFKESFSAPKQQEKPADTASILAALANIAKTKPQGGDAAPDPAPAPATGLPINIPQVQQSSVVSQVAGQPWNLADPRQRRSRSRSPSRRQSPPSNMRERSPPRQQYQQPQEEEFQPRNMSYVTDMPPGCVRVTSRTLFIGGVPGYMSEADLADQFSPFARVQSMVFHKEKKHAFVKVYTRKEAQAAKETFEQMNRSGQNGLRARWGVGFGPRDCCDYQNGVSVIPISRLTDADKRWIVALKMAELAADLWYLGLKLKSRILRLGLGVSSKAISKRMPTNSSRNGPRSTRGDDSGSSGGGSGGGGGGRYRDRERDYRHQEQSPPHHQQQPQHGAMPSELANMISGGVQQNQQYQQTMQQQQPQPPPQQPPQPPQQPGMPQMQFNPMQMMQMMQQAGGQVPPQFQQMAAFFQQQQQQQQNQQNQQ